MTELEAARQRIATLEEELAVLARQLAALTRQVFGRRSEQTPPPVPGQLDLNLETESVEELPAPPAPPDKPKGGSRKGRKVRAALLPDHLPVEETVLIHPQAAADPGNWREIDREVSERLERIPGKLVILRVVRPVLVRKDQPFAAPVTAPAPPQFLPGQLLRAAADGGSGAGKIPLSPAALPSGQSPGMGKRGQNLPGHAVTDHFKMHHL